VILDLPITLAERYEVSRFLGAGSFAETYYAQDRETGQDVAVKVHRPQFVSHRETLTRFEREARATSEIVHPNVVRTLDFRMDGDAPFMVMEYVSGPDLKVLLQERGRFSTEDAVTATVQILAGLDAIHQNGMVHRDVKPHNVLTDPEHGARLSDFGIARALDQTGLTKTGTALGTASYMAPEQAQGREVTPATDIYAVGVMLFEMLTGGVPFTGNDPLEVLYQQVHQEPPSLREINPEIPAWLETITLRAMSKEPVDRYSSANEMIQALNSGNGSEDATRPIDPALIAAQAATAAMPARPARPVRPTPPAPSAPPRARSAPAVRSSRWYQAPAIIFAALLVVGLAVGALYVLGPGDSLTDDDEPVTVVDDEDDAVDDELPADEIEPAAPVEEQDEPTQPEAPPEVEEQEPVEEAEPAPEVEEAPADETPVEEEEVEESPEPEPADDANQPEQDNSASNQGNPPDHAGGDRGEERSGGQGGGNEGQGQGNN
jgi:eukaryotic-like serine/threonine-protein kinase